MKKFKEHIKNDIAAEQAFQRVVQDLTLSREPSPADLTIISKDAAKAAAWAFHTGQRFPEGEAAIASNGYTALQYAISVIRGRFPEGEAAIKQNADLAFVYKKRVTRGQDF